MQTEKTSPWLIAFRIIFTIALIACIAFIFRNSLESGALSSARSQAVMQKINEILSEIKKSDMSRVIFKNSQMYKYFPRYYSAEQMKEEIIALLEKDYKRKERQRKKEEKKNV